MLAESWLATLFQRGRKASSAIAERNKAMVEAWFAVPRAYRNFGELGRAFNVSRGVAKKVIDRRAKIRAK